MMLPSHPLYYFSTHNALRGADGDDLHFRVCFEELHGSRSCELDIYPFYDVQMVKRLLIKKLRLPASMQVTSTFKQSRIHSVNKSVISCTCRLISCLVQPHLLCFLLDCDPVAKQKCDGMYEGGVCMAVGYLVHTASIV